MSSTDPKQYEGTSEMADAFKAGARYEREQRALDDAHEQRSTGDLPTLEEIRAKPTSWHQDPENQKIVQRVLNEAGA